MIENDDIWKDYGEGYESDWCKEEESEKVIDDSLLNNHTVHSFQLDEYFFGELK